MTGDAALSAHEAEPAPGIPGSTGAAGAPGAAGGPTPAEGGPSAASGPATADDPAREAARQRVESRREFSSHLVAYLVVNTMLVAVWAGTGAGYFWPAWVLGTWGVGLVLHSWEVFLRQPVTDSDVDAELTRLRKHNRGG